MLQNKEQQQMIFITIVARNKLTNRLTNEIKRLKLKFVLSGLCNSIRYD